MLNPVSAVSLSATPKGTLVVIGALGCYVGVLQVYAPLDQVHAGAFHRSIFLFVSPQVCINPPRVVAFVHGPVHSSCLQLTQRIFGNEGDASQQAQCMFGRGRSLPHR